MATCLSSTEEYAAEVPPEIVAAYRDAKSRGLPDGWTCTIDKRHRRKWTAPNNGRSCDSIPKAIGISVEMGLLPPDTVIPSGKRKRSASEKRASKKKKKTALKKKKTSMESAAVASGSTATLQSPNDDEEEDVDVDDDEESVFYEEEDTSPPPAPLDPETALDAPETNLISLPTTVHWDPNSPDGRKVGWKVRIAYGAASDDTWVDGRVVRYDPHSHKHKIELATKKKSSVWIWLRNKQHNLFLATRMVWAHVKGYAWWPALVMESESREQREGYVLLEFFGTGEISTLRDSPECIRPFSPLELDPVVAKHRKKRNAKAYAAACEEYHAIRRARNGAAVFYAQKAVSMVNVQQRTSNPSLSVGKRVQIFRPDVNYPYGDTVVGKIRQYSLHQKKWLLSFEISDKQSKAKTKYDAAWINIVGKEHALQIVDKKKAAADDPTVSNENILPYLIGYEVDDAEAKASETGDEDSEQEIARMLKVRCRGCCEYWNNNETNNRVSCQVCKAEYHLACIDPPLSLDAWQRMIREGMAFVCSRCTPCRGCYQKDIVYGSYVLSSPPPMLTFPPGESLDLCSMCREAYDAQRFCPNCAHIWDDKKFDMVKKQIEWGPSGTKGRKRKGGSGKDPADMIEDSGSELQLGSFSDDAPLPVGARVPPSFFYPETSYWGYKEDEMLVCDSCCVWVHAGCAGVTEDEYNVISSGKHPIYSEEFLCRVCCRGRCRDIIAALQKEDKKMLFAAPVDEKVAPNYHDVIKEPMDLKTMLANAENDEYLNYAWIRDQFELMVLNALTFNNFYTAVWLEARKFYLNSLQRVFSAIGKAAPAGKYDKAIQANFKRAEEAKQKEEDRVQIDDSVEKKDLVAGALAMASVTLPALRDAPPDQPSCVPFQEAKLKSLDAFYCSWMDCCYTCGSSGASDTFLYCVDCGEAFHSFCASAPIHSMGPFSVAGWRCPNCKICEISGDVPTDETRMIYCEMCDRAFSLDLLDPPLESAPPGLWICGQCVDCRSCGNTSEKRGASLAHWSRDPDKCYRCGGCEGLVDEYIAEMKCQICARLLRFDDDDVVNCQHCEARVHVACDERAEDCVRFEQSASRAQRVQKIKNFEYSCPRCFKPSALDSESPESERKYFSDQAWQLIRQGHMQPHEDLSAEELHYKLMEEIDMSIRSLWRNEYVSIIRDALRIYEMSNSVGGPRVAIQQALERLETVPRWMGQRAFRFVGVVKRNKLDSAGFSDERTEVMVFTAKLAAAFIDIVGPSLGVNKGKDVSFYARMLSLLQAPGGTEEFVIPIDRIRRSKDSITIDESGIILNIEEGTNEFEEQVVPESEDVIELPSGDQSPAMIASPLCGWSSEVGSVTGMTEWKDPRECCLCHLCGDDDAGFTEHLPGVPAPDRASLGRLLPMLDGYWVHTACALWSSEVWVSDDCEVYAVDKARSRGAQLKCFGCGRPGATVGCNKSNCPMNYHFPCAKACGAVFASNQHVYCANHKSSATSILAKESFEHMKTLLIEPDKQKFAADKESQEGSDADLCLRVGALVVHSLGTVEAETDGFHTENYITPPGYVASRIFWSAQNPRSRTVYILKVEQSPENEAVFTIIPGDDPSAKIRGHSASHVYTTLMERVKKVNAPYFNQRNMFSKLPILRRTRRKTFGLNGSQFFGFGLDPVRKLLESSPGVEAVVAPLTPSSPKYRFCFVYGPDPDTFEDAVMDLQRRRAAAKAEKALENASGCARTEGMEAVAQSGGSGRITRALVRSAEEDVGDSGSTKSSMKGEEKTKADKNLVQVKYRRMKEVPIEQRLVARRSHIHGWGLFTKIAVAKYDPVVEYMGEIIRRPVADLREKAYELSGEGSCYMFRLDLQRIVDATKIGCMARFMNHSCQPNAYAKIISVDTDLGPDRKIVVFANRDIAAGEEITYDYKFPVEDGSLRCTCGAPNCIGRLN